MSQHPSCSHLSHTEQVSTVDPQQGTSFQGRPGRFLGLGQCFSSAVQGQFTKYTSNLTETWNVGTHLERTSLCVSEL